MLCLVELWSQYVGIQVILLWHYRLISIIHNLLKYLSNPPKLKSRSLFLSRIYHGRKLKARDGLTGPRSLSDMPAGPGGKHRMSWRWPHWHLDTARAPATCRSEVELQSLMEWKEVSDLIVNLLASHSKCSSITHRNTCLWSVSVTSISPGLVMMTLRSASHDSSKALRGRVTPSARRFVLTSVMQR